MSGNGNRHGWFFDVWSPFYESTPILGRALFLLQDEAIALLDPRPGERVLDLGCGPARGSRQLVSRGARAVAADYSHRMVARAKQLLGSDSSVVRLDAIRLPFAAESLDGVLCTNSFHHYPEPRACLAEMRRVLKPGGRLVLVDPCAESIASRFVIHVGEGFLFGLEGVHVHSAAEWGAMLRESGFREASAKRGAGLSPIRRAEVFVRARA